MGVHQLLAQATDTITVRRVFGEPIERDGTLIIPVAKVRGGGGGGGSGPDEAGGGGFAVLAAPVGAYSVREGVVAWHPALDLNRTILGGQLVGVAVLLTVRSVLTRRRRR